MQSQLPSASGGPTCAMPGSFGSAGMVCGRSNEYDLSVQALRVAPSINVFTVF